MGACVGSEAFKPPNHGDGLTDTRADAREADAASAVLGAQLQARAVAALEAVRAPVGAGRLVHWTNGVRDARGGELERQRCWRRGGEACNTIVCRRTIERRTIDNVVPNTADSHCIHS